MTPDEVKHFGNGLWLGTMLGMVLAGVMIWLGNLIGGVLALWV